MHKITLIPALVATSLLAAAPAWAGSYTLSCVNSTTGQQVSVTVTASSRDAAIETVRNDPAYADYDACQ